jgi:hypothetical protein
MSVYGQKIDNFSLPKSFAPKLVMPTFGQGKFVRRVYGCQGIFDKFTRNNSRILAALT